MVFAPQRYVLIHFAKNKADIGTDAPLMLAEVIVNPSATAKLLGVVVAR